MDPRRFVILGGGTAGWMAAALIAHRCGAAGAEVTLVESPEIGIIGVGEGSTPQLKAFFDELGIAERDWMPACNATYKTGIRFAGWSDAAGFESYFHPFASELDAHTAPAFFFHTRARRTGRDVVAHPDRFFLGGHLAEARLGPVAGANFPFELGYGYHFDATLVGQFLAGHATAKLGVRHVQRRVAGARRAAAGDIAALVLEGGEEVAGDFFLDASGFRASLIGEALGEPFESFAVRWQHRSSRAAGLPVESRNRTRFCPSRVKGLGPSDKAAMGTVAYQNLRKVFWRVCSMAEIQSGLADPEAGRLPGPKQLARRFAQMDRRPAVAGWSATR